jgi:sucrose-6-phosphate hydrolase SacC (GH32 family)
MFVNPIEEIASLHRQHWDWSNMTVRPGENPLSAITDDLFHIKMNLRPEKAQSCRFVVRTIPISYDVSSQQLTCQGKSAPAALVNGQISLEILVDRMSIEIYANGGRLYMPIAVDMTDYAHSLGFAAEGEMS